MENKNIAENELNLEPNQPPIKNSPDKRSLRYFGPGFLVAAAFIGPGTVTTAIMAGGSFGFQLLWAVGFAVFATIIFQEMAARLGLVTKKGLGEAISSFIKNPQLRISMLSLVFAAIIFGNAAYQAGNASGAAKGLSNFVPAIPNFVWLTVCSGAAAVIIWRGSLKSLKYILISLVGLMSLTFIMAAIASRPSVPDLFAGLFSLEVPWFDLKVLIAIIGTTVVPYNLFLHSSAVAEQNAELAVELRQESNHKTNSKPMESSSSGAPNDHDELNHEFDEALIATRSDTWMAVGIGGLVTASILITAAGTNAVNLTEAGNVLEPIVGASGRTLFFLGLFAAGLTSAITAPLAAGYAYAGCFGFKARADSKEVRKVAITVTGIGFLAAAIFGTSPSQIILLAQVANGLVLPIVAVFLLTVMNSKQILGQYRNTWFQNLLGGIVVLFVSALGFYQLAKAFGFVAA